jgi:prephenate dehydrogenase
MNKKVLIIGLGLIGGSIALAIKRAYPACEILGFDINKEQLQLAKTLQIIDEAVSSFEEAALSCDVIFIAAPVRQTEKIIEQLADIPFDRQVIITDVGSTKKVIMEKAKCLTEKGITFIGGHPMAGSHKSGVAAARAHLFENAYYIFTPMSDEDLDSLRELKELLKGSKAKFLTMSAEEHDFIAGVISHFPHIIAASLVHQAEKFEQENHLVTSLAAGGFRDITRIASSSPEMWRDILIHNKETLLMLLDDWLTEMDKVRTMVASNDAEKILTYFRQAKQFRDGLPVRHKGAIPSFYDLFVDVPDYPGVISEITGYLARENISITNIRIIETREEIYGVLRLSFQSEEDREKAKKCIEENTNYSTFLG